MSTEQKTKLDKMVSEFPSFEKLVLDCTNLMEHHIDTVHDTPIKCKHYPLSLPRQEEEEECLKVDPDKVFAIVDSPLPKFSTSSPIL
ncbi:hypothetical protein EVAR_72319_1 [Eumeta japonica]|uniref:Uncharacterized protein n=1 Tax=Eumeta variegata TaxID=151549 RepID=A0A4C1TSY5_EUMVA|nr:hypothetical protein EVAR_72319_1 [Eumeta japonica]